MVTFATSSSPRTVIRSQHIVISHKRADDSHFGSPPSDSEVFHSGSPSLCELSTAYLGRFCRNEIDADSQQQQQQQQQEDYNLMLSSSSSCSSCPFSDKKDEEQQHDTVGIPIPANTAPTRSCLKKNTKHSSGRATVRGLWAEPMNCTTSALSDGLLKNVFECLGMEDLVSCEQVSQRWETVASQPDLWRTVDASIFIQQSYQRNRQDSVRTTQQFTRVLQTHDIENLTFTHIGATLAADYLHLPFWRLRRITIGHFDGLTDTHIRSLLFLASLRTQTLPLRSIRLEECGRLTHKCLLAIRTLCADATCSLAEQQHAAQQRLVLQTALPHTTTSLTSLFVGAP